MKWSHLLLLIAVLGGALFLWLTKPWEKQAPPPKKPVPKKVIPKKEEPAPEPVKEEEPQETPAPVQEQPVEEDTSEEIVQYQPKDDAPAPVKEEQHIGKAQAASWRQPEQLARKLASKIASQVKTCSQEEVMNILKDPENRLAISQWELIHRSDPKKFGEVMGKADTRKAVSDLLNNLPWVSSFVYDGELKNTEAAMEMLAQMRRMDPKMDEVSETNPGEGGATLKNRVAGAIAAEFAREGWYGDDKELTPEEIRTMRQNGMLMTSALGKKKGKTDTYRLARERYDFFSESIDKQLLNGEFATLPGWLLRFPCGWKANLNWGTPTSLRWERDNCSSPARAYLGMAFQVQYLPTNVFGDSIFTEYYYAPFTHIYNGEFSHLVRDVGGVCGSLSHFGASSACANGVPAMTMGEPGHCAYAVYVDGKWTPTNSISEEHHPHWGIYGDYSWGALQMLTGMYQNGQLTRNAQMAATMGSMLMSMRQELKGMKLMELSATMQPLNSEVWTRYVDAAAGSIKRNVKKWMEVNKFLCTAMAPEYPGRCASLLREKIYPAMFEAVKQPKQKLEAYQFYFGSLNVEETGEWKPGELLDAQYDAIGKNQNAKLDFLQMVIEAAGKHTDFAPMITWAVVKAHQESKFMGKKVMEMIAAAEEASPEPQLVDAAVIRAGELLGDKEMAHSFSDKNEPPSVELPDFGKPTGNLVSDKAKIVLSEYPRSVETMLGHHAATTEKGGLIKSNQGKHRTVTMEFDRPTTLGTLVIVPNTSGKSYRAWQLEIFDGKTWKPYMNLPNAKDTDHFTITFDKAPPKVKAIRIDSGEEQSVGIQFKALLVYDNKKS